MPTISSANLLQQLNWRYATKRFDSARKIPAKTWSALEQALVLSASSFGLQPYRFLVIEDPALRAKLRPFTWDQPQVIEASHYVVFARKLIMTEADAERFIGLIAATRNVAAASLVGYRDLIVSDLVKGPRSAWVREWTARQTYIALGNLLTSAALLGIDACPIEGLDPAQYDAILGLAEKGFSTVCACALGYRSADDKYAHLAKVRFPANELIEKR